jgi:hypothetical protein
MKFGHYTSTAALVSILSTEKLWATNIKFLNDEHEFQHALSLARDVVERSKKTFAPKSEHKQAYSQFVEETTKTLDNLDAINPEAIFTCSFSEQTDLLSQWRGYCAVNQGYCIQFDVEKLTIAAVDMFQGVRLQKCVYDDAEKVKQISNALNHFWYQYLVAEDEKKKRSTIQALADGMVFLATHYKHPSFAEEREHRLVITLEDSHKDIVKFRAGPMSVVPYIEIPASRKFVNEICIGPTRNQHLAKRGLDALIESTYGVPSFVASVEIRESKIPYRA